MHDIWSIMGSMDGVRRYLYELRDKQNISQKTLAKVMRMSSRALIDWEAGVTADIKAGALFRAVDYLEGSIDEVRDLILKERSAEYGQELAEKRLRARQEGRLIVAPPRPTANVEREVDRILEEDTEELRSFIRGLYRRIRGDSEVMKHFTDVANGESHNG